MASDDSSQALYRVNIKTAASPQEVANFVKLLQDNGYAVATDLQSGKLEIRTGIDDGGGG